MPRTSNAPRAQSGAAREKLAADLKAEYEGGASVRAIAEKHSRSYGGVHRLLADAGTTFRPRGGRKRATP